jgi:predicted transport protein
VKVDPNSIDMGLYKRMARDIRGIGHQGTGDLELCISPQILNAFIP